MSLQVKADELPVEAFGSLPVSGVALSPDGNKIAYKGVSDGYIFIASLNLKTKKKKYLIHTDNKIFKLGWFRWANDNIILVSAHYPNQLGAVKFGENRLLKVAAGGSGSVAPVFVPKKNERIPQYQANVIDFIPDDPDHILIALNLDHWQYPDVYKINIASARVRRS